MFNKLCIMGVGLIGGSIARAARENKLCTQISAFGRKQDLTNLQQALDLQVIDSYSLKMREAVDGADCVIIATPVGAMPDILQQLVAYWSEHVLYMDTGSTKGSVVDALGAIFTTLPTNFVPAHPIAGAEKSGVDAALVDLFQQKQVIFTPWEQTDKKFLQLAKQFWQGLGSHVSEMQVVQHDTVLAATSHLPHIIAFALVDLLGRKDEQDIFKYAAEGFKDFTRIASSNPTMWQDICLANKQHIIPLIEQLCSRLETVKYMLQNNQTRALHDTFTYARNARQRFLDQRNNMDQSITFTVQPGGHLQGQVRVPGDKSISHRSIMLGSLAEGITHISGFLEGDDALTTLRAFQMMGVKIEGPENGKVSIHGVGLDGLQAPKKPIYLGNSGTSMRLICGLLAGQKFTATLTGDKSLSGRPMRRLTDPLAKMGAVIETTENGTAPLTIIGQSGALQGIHYEMPIASAQVKSCLLLAGLYAQGETSVTEPAPTRDHTERMLSGFSHPVKQEANKVTISRHGTLLAADIDVPSDISSAAFFLVGASIAPDSDLTLKHVGINPTRTGVINILQLMGANIELFNQRTVSGEPVADIRVRSTTLKGIAIPEKFVALAIDEFPVLFVAAACAEGVTTLIGAKELRVKESDRIQVMAEGLQILGVDAQATEDGMVINGGSIGGGTVMAHGDHRIAMAFSMAGLRATDSIVIQDCENVNTSFPGFASLTSDLGLKISSEEG